MLGRSVEIRTWHVCRLAPRAPGIKDKEILWSRKKISLPLPYHIFHITFITSYPSHPTLSLPSTPWHYPHPALDTYRRLGSLNLPFWASFSLVHYPASLSPHLSPCQGNVKNNAVPKFTRCPRQQEALATVVTIVREAEMTVKLPGNFTLFAVI